MKYNPRDENSIKAVMAKANVVINLIGMILYDRMSNYNLLYFHCFMGKMLLRTGREYETRNFSFEEVNHHMAENLAVVRFFPKYFLFYSDDFHFITWSTYCQQINSLY